MRTYLFIAFTLLCFNTGAQITLEHTYDTASSLNTYVTDINQLMFITFEESGEHYVKINRVSRMIDIYDTNHSILKKINCASLPSNPNGTMGDILYLSENLFDTDSQIEFMYVYTFGSPYTKGATKIVKENGVVLFSDTGGPAVHPNWPMQQWPIYNTSQGTKMILSYSNRQAKVFSLPGTLSLSIEHTNMQLMQQSGAFGNLYPNPGPGAVTIEYELPMGEAEGEIVLYNMAGLEVKRYGVDYTFKDIYLDNSMLPAGTYLWQLQTAKGAVGSKKMVIIK